MNKRDMRYWWRPISCLLCMAIFSAPIIGFQSASSLTLSLSPNDIRTGVPASYSPSQHFYYPTSGIRILVVNDPSTGAQDYAEEWRSLLDGYGYDASLLSLQETISNPFSSNDYDLVLIDHSCGGEYGSEISLEEAENLVELGKPIVLLGGAHAVIDRIVNYGGGFGQIGIAGAIQKAPGEADHTIYSSPYPVTEVGYGATGSVEVLAQGVTLESYPENAVGGLHPFAVLEGAARPIIGALYSSRGNTGRLFWWAFEDPFTLNGNGHNLFVNTIEWMGGFTNLKLLLRFLEGLEILDTSASTYFGGGYADYFEPQILPTFYAYTSLKLAGRAGAISVAALTDWLLANCYSDSEGYFHSPNRYLSSVYSSGIAETGMALRILSDLGTLNRVNSSKVSAFIKSCQLTDGFGRYPGDTSNSLTDTYWALIGLNVTGGLAGINRTGAMNYILSCQNLNQDDRANYGGFADHPGGISFATYTLMAIVSLELLAAMGSIDQSIVEHWLMDGYVASEGIFYDEHESHQRHTVNYGTGYAIATLSILGKLQNINCTLVADHLSSVQFTDGGWSGANCTDEPIDEVADCYPVILALSQLDRIDAIKNPEGFTRFIMRCLSPAPAYGFSNLPRTISNLWQTNGAIAILDDLGVIYASKVGHLNDSIISSYDPDSARFEWVRYCFPFSSDGYSYVSVEQPFEFTTLQRGKRGVIMTDLAVTALLKLGSRSWISAHAEDLWNELARCEALTGPYAGYYKLMSGDLATNLTAGLRYTYHALNCLQALAGFLNYTPSFADHLADATMTIERIMSHYDPFTGSFRDDPYVLEPYSHVETTALALASLSILGGLSNVDHIRTAEFLQSNMYSSLMDTYYSFKGLQQLNRLSSINSTRLTEYVLRYQRPSGALKSGDTEQYRLDSTRMCLEILSFYNTTWAAAKPIRLLANNLQFQTSMQQGSSYLVNLTIIDDLFMLPVAGASAEIRLGAYEYMMIESSSGNGQYIANILVPTDGTLLGLQNLSIRCSKGTYQTGFAQAGIEVLRQAGSANKTMTDIRLVHPHNGEYLTTSNTSILVSIYALNESENPIEGAELQLFVNDSMTEVALSNSTGLLEYGWKPSSQGTYVLRVLYEGSSTLDGSEAEEAIRVNKTPCQLLIFSNYAGPGIPTVGDSQQLRALLSETGTERPIAGAGICFIVVTPSGVPMSLLATTDESGVAITQLTFSEAGNYSICSMFASTDYYAGCDSNTVSVNVGYNSQEGGEDESWVDALINALGTPLGAGLVIASIALLITAYSMRTKRREPEPVDSS